MLQKLVSENILNLILFWLTGVPYGG